MKTTSFQLTATITALVLSVTLAAAQLPVAKNPPSPPKNTPQRPPGNQSPPQQPGQPPVALPTPPPTPKPPQPPNTPPPSPPVQPSPVPPPASPPQLPPPTGGAPLLGGPLSGLTQEELDAFNEGRQEFVTVETRASGLGPIFNQASCVACHRAPAPGGASRIFVTRFGRMTDAGFDPLENLGGSLLQSAAISPRVREVIPKEANVIARRQTTPLFGLGLIEAIPDETILALADRPEVDGVKGRAAIITDIVSGEKRVGRFGWKNQQATLLAFSADAYLNEMGITNRFFPKENAPNGRTDVLAQFDIVPDIEDQPDPVTGRSDIDAVTDFMRLLAPPAAAPLSAAATAGRDIFNSVGCAVCHVPELTTGASTISALDQKTVALYSDLLLHDMGALGDGIAQADAGTREMRTPPLWGLGASAPYLHDGRAVSIDAAIRLHDGESRTARDRYQALTPADRLKLLEFLKTL